MECCARALPATLPATDHRARPRWRPVLVRSNLAAAMMPGEADRLAGSGSREPPPDNRPPDEAELVERAQAGDAAAYEELVRRHAEVAFRVAHVITGDAADAEDAAQEGFLAGWQALHRFTPGAPLRPWLLRIIANRARNRRRSAWRRTSLSIRAAAQAHLDVAADPEASVEAAEERAALLRAVSTLKRGDREVIACRFFLDLSIEETAEVLRCAPGTVKSRLFRGLGRLRAAMGTAS